MTRTEVIDLRELARRTYQSDRVVATLLGLLTISAIVVAGLFVVFLGNIDQNRSTKPASPGITFASVALEVDEGEAGTAGIGFDATAGGGKNLNQETPIDVIDTPAHDASVITNTAASGQDAIELTDTVIGCAVETSDILGPKTTIAGPDKSGDGTVCDTPPGVIKKSQRWEIRYAEQSLEQYARQLDFFNIDVAIAKGQTITYVSDLSKRVPTVRTNENGLQEKRIYFAWQDADRQRADARLLSKSESRRPMPR